MMKQIIINADDFGINEIVTSEIERLILAGAVSSTTVMANGICLEEVKRFAGEHPEASYGIHLCLTEYCSMTKSEDLHHIGLTDENGLFIHKSIFHLNNYNDNSVQKAIKDELNAQIDVVSSLGFHISHADSHHHVHTIYPLRKLFAEVLQKRGISKIRLGTDFQTWRYRKHLLSWLWRVELNKYYSSQFITANAFCSYSDYLLRRQRQGKQVVELMCHPGHPKQKYLDEIKLVESKNVINNNDVKVITYNDLH